MSVKLIKTIDEQGAFYVLSGKNLPENYVLSDKNCQAIERGYDVYDLAKENYHKFWSVVDESEMLNHTFGYVEGFQKALEVNADKRFTLKDMADCWNKALTFQEHKETLGEHIQSLQQTEWDVEICCKMDCQGDWDECKNTSFECELCTNTGVPQLDADGCLILKRL